MVRKTLVKLLAALTAFGVVVGAAASLGGITSSNLGADDGVVASCDTDGITTSYTSGWDATDKRYEVTAVAVGGMGDACDGQTLRVSLTDSTGAQIGTGSVTVPTAAGVGTANVTLTTQPSSELTTGVNATIASS